MTLEEERRPGGWAAADRVTDCRPEPSLQGSPFASLGPAGERLRGWEGRREWSACLPPACLALSPVSLQLPKRQLLIWAVGASVLCSKVSASPPPALLFLFFSEHTEPTGKSGQRLQDLSPHPAPPTPTPPQAWPDWQGHLGQMEPATPSKEHPAWVSNRPGGWSSRAASSAPLLPGNCLHLP